MPFLTDIEPRSLTIDAPAGIQPQELFVGNGGMALEVATFTSNPQPAVTQLRDLHRTRVGKRAAPLLVVVLWGQDRAAICGGPPDDLFAQTDLDRGQVERLCRAALSAADRHAAIRYLAQALPQLVAPIPGLRNEGLFALHELSVGVPRRPDWTDAARHARPALTTRGRTLIERLGFSTQPLPGPASLLLSRGNRTAVAVFLERPDLIEPPLQSYDGLSPVSYALAKADQERLDYVVVSAGSVIRVYPVKPGVGTGRRGRTETFVELNLDLLRESDAGYLWLLCSADALTDGGSFSDVLASSEDYAADLSTRLRDRVYGDVVPGLARAISAARALPRPTAAQLAETYDMALLVLFRLLFIAYAEDKELLPLHGSAAYREHSLKHMAQRLLDERHRGVVHGSEDFYWTEVGLLWRAVDRGNPAWNVPAYNGGLFSEDGDDSAGRLRAISLPDDAIAPALASLLLDETPDGGVGPIDFRSLGVREFGTIYEGLLESELSLAETDLTVQARTGAYLPADDGGDVVVSAGEVYLHNASGARKSSGAYYTKSFAVEHLLDAALEPALDDHLGRLGQLDDRQASEKFFDFRVADIAMGSGHFLVAAIDRIERRFSNYLAERQLPGVRDELERLRAEALRQLGEDWAGESLEDTQLLRRQIARRCIFGVDLNSLAVELARLSIWIHTFVPGLPLSLLDQNLVVGNSLVGIATFEEASDIVAGGGDLFSFSAEQRLGRAREPLRQLARLADATAAEIREARELHRDVQQRTRGEAALLTILAASRIDADVRQAVDQGQIATLLEGDRDVFTEGVLRKAEAALDGLNPLHFPIAFPQVFLGERGGFDVIVGNPPWEKSRVEEHEFWARHSPGLRALATAKRNRAMADLRRRRPDLLEYLHRERAAAETLRNAVRNFPGMNTGHPDLFRAFWWRFIQLLARDRGRMGVVLPGDAFKVRGARELREAFVERCATIDVQMASNRGYWLFEGVDSRKLVAFVAASIGRADNANLYIHPEVHSLHDWHLGTGNVQPRSASWLRKYSPGLVIPILPSDSSLELLESMMIQPRLRSHPSLNVARVYADFETTRDKQRWHGLREEGDWPVYKGESFDVWNPDTGRYYGFTSGNEIAEAAHERRSRASSNSPYGSTDPAWRADAATHPVRFPRISFRDVTNRTNQRTLIAALIPPEVVTTQSAPWILWYSRNDREVFEAILLGCMASLVLDWWMRRFVEGHVDQEAFESLPVPELKVSASLESRISALAGRLAAPDDRFAEWAESVGVEYGPLAEDEKQDMIHELDAAVAHLYGLREAHLVHIFETFHEGWDYQNRLDATLQHFADLKRVA